MENSLETTANNEIQDISAKENKTNEENRRMIYEAVPENAIESESKDKSNIISNSNSQKSINQSTEEKVPKETIIEDTINIKPLNPLEDIRESDDTFLLENRLPSLSDSQHMMYTADDNLILTKPNEIKSELKDTLSDTTQNQNTMMGKKED